MYKENERDRSKAKEHACILQEAERQGVKRAEGMNGDCRRCGEGERTQKGSRTLHLSRFSILLSISISLSPLAVFPLAVFIASNLEMGVRSPLDISLASVSGGAKTF